MNKATEAFKKSVRDLKAYHLSRTEPKIKINQNENPWDWPDSVKEGVLKRIAEHDWNRYPDFIPEELNKRIASYAGWREDGVISANGSNEIIYSLIATTTGPGTEVLLAEPTFTVYRQLVAVFGGTVRAVSLDALLGFDVDGIVAALKENPAIRLAVLCSPNNPTGSALKEEDTRRILDAAPGIVALDQAYIEFSDKSFDLVPLMKEYDNLVIFRTFSKALSLAGCRLGYMLAVPEVITEVTKGKLPYNIGFMTQVAGMELLGQKEWINEKINLIIKERDELMKAIAAVPGIRVVPSQANFFLIELEDPRRVFNRLYEEYGILIRDITSYPMLDKFLRVTVGKPEENKKLLDALRQILK